MSETVSSIALMNTSTREFLEKNKKIESLEAQLREANKVLEMVQDHRKMPHWHDNQVIRLYCLTERANEYFEKFQEKKDERNKQS